MRDAVSGGEPLLSVTGLKVHFGSGSAAVSAVEDVSFDLQAAETVGVVGESGSGKSVMARSLLRLVRPPGRCVAGRILFQGEDLLQKTPAQMRDIRGNRISMIFQEPMTSLQPVLTVGYQIAEVLRLHHGLSTRQARREAVSLLRKVHITDPERRVTQYPHELSGGMRQRVMIAMALACRPKLLLADEPTTALDVTIQAQILDLIDKLQRESGMSIILITHNLGVVAEISQRVLVMYSGWLVEMAPTKELFRNPQHPYTVALLNSVPRLDRESRRLQAIEGTLPNPAAPPAGCRFHPRCPHTLPICTRQEPPELTLAPGRFVKCWLHADSRSAA